MSSRLVTLLNEQSLGQVLALIAAATLAAPLLWTFYTFTLHPLARFPGPKLAKISNLYYSRLAMQGNLPWHIQNLHKTYGRVVRIAPNELSFAGAKAFKDIYNQTGEATFVKSTFYKTSNFEASDIIGESDVQVHANMRRLWARGFSAQALQQHEDLEQRYVDLAIKQMGQHGQGPAGIDIVSWFNFMTFDIIGELVFGESFGATASGSASFWISVILGNMEAGLIVDVIRRMGLFIGFKWLISQLPFEKIKDMNRHQQITREMAARRLEKKPTEKNTDFLGYMLEGERRDIISVEEVAAQGQNLVIAGTETTATTLSATVYFLLTHPEAYARFTTEIRNAFDSADQISSGKVGTLPYFHAVLDETMRLYPPVPFAPPRLSPGSMVDGVYVPQGTEVSVHAWTVGRDAAYFKDPDSFDPTRWLTNDGRAEKDAFFPFHLGPRVCLGRNLAFIELRLMLAKLFLQYDLVHLNPEVRWVNESKMFILWNKPDLRVRLVPRPGAKA